MIDSHKRLINYLRVSITDRCNLRCIYCMPKEGLSLIGHDDILRYEEILRIVGEAVRMGISKVRITGGEPLARRGVVDFFRSLRSIDGLEDVSLTTNGILLGHYADDLVRAGMTRINISLDSLQPDRYASITRGGDLHAVLQGIKTVHTLGLAPIKINVVVIKGFNDDEVLDFARLTLDKPFQIRFIELMPLGTTYTHNGGRYLSNDIVKSRIEAVYGLRSLNGDGSNKDGPARLFRLSDGVGTVGFISPVSHHFCATCNRLRLTADGHLRACLLSDEETNLKEPLRTGCTDRDLHQLIEATLEFKPLRHHITEEQDHAGKCLKEMSAIGG
jgi:cyclic pyranopterin phosphate synthase